MKTHQASHSFIHLAGRLVLAGLLLATTTAFLGAVDAKTERMALRTARGEYGTRKNSPIPDGLFKGKVKNTYREHAEMKLTLRPGRGKSTARLNVWDGANHITKFNRITARVRKGGKLVRLTGGRVHGNGLLPLGIRIRNGKMNGEVDLRPRDPDLECEFRLSGVDLTNANAPVSGKAKFRGEQD